MQHSAKRARRVVLLWLLTVNVAGCTTITTLISGTKTTFDDVVVTEDFCETVPQISYSRRDNPYTIEPIIGINAALTEICSGDASVIDRSGLCDTLGPITLLGDITPETQVDVEGFNAAYKSMCGVELGDGINVD